MGNRHIEIDIDIRRLDIEIVQLDFQAAHDHVENVREIEGKLGGTIPDYLGCSILRIEIEAIIPEQHRLSDRCHIGCIWKSIWVCI